MLSIIPKVIGIATRLLDFAAEEVTVLPKCKGVEAVVECVHGEIPFKTVVTLAQKGEELFYSFVRERPDVKAAAVFQTYPDGSILHLAKLLTKYGRVRGFEARFSDKGLLEVLQRRGFASGHNTIFRLVMQPEERTIDATLELRDLRGQLCELSPELVKNFSIGSVHVVPHRAQWQIQLDHCSSGVVQLFGYNDPLVSGLRFALQPYPGFPLEAPDFDSRLLGHLRQVCVFGTDPQGKLFLNPSPQLAFGQEVFGPTGVIPVFSAFLFALGGALSPRFWASPHQNYQTVG